MIAFCVVSDIVCLILWQQKRWEILNVRLFVVEKRRKMDLLPLAPFSMSFTISIDGVWWNVPIKKKKTLHSLFHLNSTRRAFFITLTRYQWASYLLLCLFLRYLTLRRQGPSEKQSFPTQRCQQEMEVLKFSGKVQFNASQFQFIPDLCYWGVTSDRYSLE